MALGQTAALIALQQEGSYSETEKWNPTSYRTLLITFRDGKARLAADIPFLIVPRKDGFWRLGVVHNGTTNDYEETAYAVPVFSDPPAPAHSENGKGRDDDDENCASSDDVTITFVNPEVVSVEHHSASNCGMHPSGELDYGTYRIDDLKTPLEITAVLGLGAAVAQARSAPEQHPSDDCGVLDPPDSSNWGIKWLPGEWTVLSVYSVSQVCGGDHSYEVKFTPPASVVGSVSTLASRSRAAMAKKLSYLQRDSVLTPSGDFLITFGNPIEVFRVSGQQLSAVPVLSIKNEGNGASPVMVQWALRKYVIKWEGAVNEIGARLADRRTEPGATR